MYSLNETSFFYDYNDGIAVIIDFSSGIYYSGSRCMSAILDALVNGASQDALIAALKAFPAAPCTVEQDLSAFIATLLEKNILQKSDTILPSYVDLPSDLLAEGWNLSLECHDDVKDIIMADPI